MNKSVSTVLLLLIYNFCYSQHDHGSHNHGGTEEIRVQTPPHGGTVKESGKYHIEMVVNSFAKENQMAFYVMKGNYKPIANLEITGSITFERQDESTISKTLKKEGYDHFVTDLMDSEYFLCTIDFVIKGKKIRTYFPLGDISREMAISYSCPMHSDIKSDKEDKCPKCGMKLEKK